MSLAEVSAILWRERELLELLLFKLEEQQLVLGSGRSRWLERAGAEVELFVDEIRKVELIRAVEVVATARAIDHEGELSLTGLAQLSDQPWQDLLLDHRSAFLVLADEIHAKAELSRDLLGVGPRAPRSLCDFLK